MKFSIGQKVWAACNRPELGNGELQAVIVGYTSTARLPYMIEIEGCANPPGFKGWTAKEEWLRPRDDDDPNKVGSWSDIGAIFKPSLTKPVTVDSKQLDLVE